MREPFALAIPYIPCATSNHLPEDSQDRRRVVGRIPNSRLRACSSTTVALQGEPGVNSIERPRTLLRTRGGKSRRKSGRSRAGNYR